MTSRFISRELRKQVIKRDDCRCQYCNKMAITGIQHEGEFYQVFSADKALSMSWKPDKVEKNVPYEIDHIIPHFFGGETIINNLVLACRSCNRSKGIKIDRLA